MNDLDMRQKAVGDCPICLRGDFHHESCPIARRDREIIHRNQEVKSKVEEIHSLLGQLSTIRAERDRMKKAGDKLASLATESVEYSDWEELQEAVEAWDDSHEELYRSQEGGES